MTPVYSTVFMAGIASPLSIEYTIPDGLTAIVRDVDVLFLGDTAGSSFSLQELASGSFIAHSEALPAGTMYSWRGRQVVPQTIIIQASSTGSALVSVRVSGYLLTA